MHLRTLAAATFVVATVVATVATATPAGAETRALNPPPPTGFGYTCSTVGSGTICRAAETVTYGPDPTDIPCGFDVYDAGTVRVRRARYYDTDGNLTRRVQHYVVPFGQWSNPASGRTVQYAQSNVEIDVLDTPGDLHTSTLAVTGQIVIRGATGAPVLFATGRQLFYDESELLSTHGRNDLMAAFFQGDPTALDGVCNALS